mgnify:CR=1 FL=1
MKQEEEPWIDHLKQRVNEYEKPLPENDWNHFQTEFFTPYLHKRRRMKTMRIAAVFFLIFIPFATTFYFLQTEKHEAASPVVSLPACQPRSITGSPSIMPENKLLQDRTKSKTASLTRPPIQTSIHTDTANKYRNRVYAPRYKIQSGIQNLYTSALPDTSTLHYRISVPDILWHLPYLPAITEQVPAS